MTQRLDAKNFAAEVIEMVCDSDMHKLLVLAELIDAIATVLADAVLDEHIANMRGFALGVRRAAITDDDE